MHKDLFVGLNALFLFVGLNALFLFVRLNALFLFVRLNALFLFVRLNALKTFSPVHLLFQLTKLKKTSFLSENGLKTSLYKGILLIGKGWS